jgi:hypothetical protein
MKRKQENNDEPGACYHFLMFSPLGADNNDKLGARCHLFVFLCML